VPGSERSGDELRARLESTPDEWLDRRVEMIDTDITLSGWRVLAMMVEQHIHHRSQLETYAGLNGWSVPDILGRRAEEIGVRRRSETHVRLAAERRLFLARWRSLIGELAA